jgi:polysaccharide export outer membrane protein
MLRVIERLFVLASVSLLLSVAPMAAADGGDYQLGQGDNIHIQVFQNPDLTLDTRVSEGGSITYPLIGTVQIGGLTLSAAEQTIAKALKDGGFVQQPQVSVVLVANRGNQVSVLGYVGKPGRFPLETFSMRLSEILAIAGGITPTGSDTVIVSGLRAGKPYRKEIDVPGLFLGGTPASDDIIISGGDAVFVPRAPMYYIYGEVQRPGSFRIERNMTVQQALAQAGGPTARGSEYRLRLHRRSADGKVEKLSPDWNDPVQADDMYYIRESLF